MQSGYLIVGAEPFRAANGPKLWRVRWDRQPEGEPLELTYLDATYRRDIETEEAPGLDAGRDHGARAVRRRGLPK